MVIFVIYNVSKAAKCKKAAIDLPIFIFIKMFHCAKSPFCQCVIDTSSPQTTVLGEHYISLYSGILAFIRVYWSLFGYGLDFTYCLDGFCFSSFMQARSVPVPQSLLWADFELGTLNSRLGAHSSWSYFIVLPACLFYDLRDLL